MAESFPHLARIRAQDLEPDWEMTWGEIEENKWYETDKDTPYHKYLQEFRKSPKMRKLVDDVLKKTDVDYKDRREKVLVFSNFPASK